MIILTLEDIEAAKLLAHLRTHVDINEEYEDTEVLAFLEDMANKLEEEISNN